MIKKDEFSDPRIGMAHSSLAKLNQANDQENVIVIDTKREWELLINGIVDRKGGVDPFEING